MDLLLWVIRGIIIAVGIILAIVIWKGKKVGKYQEYSLRFFVIGITAFILGIFLLYTLYLIAAGVIAVIIGLVIWKIWEKNR